MTTVKSKEVSVLPPLTKSTARDRSRVNEMLFTKFTLNKCKKEGGLYKGDNYRLMRRETLIKRGHFQGRGREI